MTASHPERDSHLSMATRCTRIGAMHGQDAEQEWHWFVARYRPFVHGLLSGMLGNGSKATAAKRSSGATCG